MSNADLQREKAAERRAGLHALIVVWVMTLLSWAINSTSIIIEQRRDGLAAQAGEAWFIEGSSALFILLLFFGVRWLERRFPLSLRDWPVVLGVHILGAVAFSCAHIVAMGVAREALVPLLFDHSYDFFGDPLTTFVYEFRKDAMTYLAQLLVLSAFRSIEWSRMDAEAARQHARTTQHLTLKCGGRIVRIEAGQFVSAKAAGNYAEIRLETGDHLARITLAELQSQLANAGVDAVRVHRSWLVNEAAIAEIAPTGEGDITLTLTNGDRVPGSRRYRGRLKSA